MAMIQCPNCGKDISDRAVTCPGCGYSMVQNEPAKEKKCIECGTVLEEGATTCPNCGCPVDDPVDNKETIHKVEVSKVAFGEKQKKMLIYGIVAVVAVIVLIFGGMQLKKQSDKKAAAKISADYKENLSSAATSMLMGAIEAENCGGLIHDVWYNTIYSKYDSKTSKYTSGHSDFNDSLAELFKDSDFSGKIESIKSNQELVKGYMKSLTNPPAEYEDAYSAIKELYDSYNAICNCATNPTGNLNSYTSTFNDADSGFSQKYDSVKMYIE